MPTSVSDRTIPHQLHHRAAEAPDHVALVVDGVTELTLAQWDTRSSTAAAHLQSRGVRPGDRVVLSFDAPDSIGYAIAYVAVHKAGAVAVPVAASSGHAHVSSLVQRARAVTVIASHPVHADVSTFTLSSLSAAPSRPFTAVPLGPDDDAEILYTSGTTGDPKGVVATHANLLSAWQHATRSSHPRTALHALPLATNASQGLLIQPLHPSPHRVIILARFQSGPFMDAIGRYRPTDVILLPAHAYALLRHAPVPPTDLSSVSLVRSVSAPITGAALEGLTRLFPAATVMNMYTTTEAWPARLRIAWDPQRPTAVGRPQGRSQLRIVGAAGESAPPGEHGEVHLRISAAPPRRYDSNTVASTDVFLPGGWVRTGDIGYVDSDGYLYLLDRPDDLVISGGLNISSLEVENAAARFPGVSEAAAVGVPHATLGQALVLAIRAPCALDRTALLAFLCDQLGAPRSPKRIVFVDDFPRGTTGKVLKRDLRQQLASAPGEPEPASPPAPDEDRIRTIWAEALGIPDVPSDADFLSLGGDSLAAMEVAAAVAERLGHEVGYQLLFTSPTVRAFAHSVTNAPPTASRPQTHIPRLPRKLPAIAEDP